MTYEEGYWHRVNGTAKLSETRTADERDGWIAAEDEIAAERRQLAS